MGRRVHSVSVRVGSEYVTNIDRLTLQLPVAKSAADDASRFLLTASTTAPHSDAPLRFAPAATRSARAPSASRTDSCHRRSTTAASPDHRGGCGTRRCDPRTDFAQAWSEPAQPSCPCHGACRLLPQPATRAFPAAADSFVRQRLKHQAQRLERNLAADAHPS